MNMSIRERVRRRRGHDARAVANILIEKGIRRENPITPLQVMKVLYFCHGWTLADLGRPLIRQPFEVWRFGPVVRDVYHALKHHGRAPVSQVIPGTEDTHDFDGEEHRVIDAVFDDYGFVNGLILSYLTHQPGGPWDEVRLSRGEGRGIVIPNPVIQRHFKSMTIKPTGLQ